MAYGIKRRVNIKRSNNQRIVAKYRRSMAADKAA